MSSAQHSAQVTDCTPAAAPLPLLAFPCSPAKPCLLAPANPSPTQPRLLMHVYQKRFWFHAIYMYYIVLLWRCLHTQQLNGMLIHLKTVPCHNFWSAETCINVILVIWQMREKNTHTCPILYQMKTWQAASATPDTIWSHLSVCDRLAKLSPISSLQPIEMAQGQPISLNRPTLYTVQYIVHRYQTISYVTFFPDFVVQRKRFHISTEFCL